MTSAGADPGGGHPGGGHPGGGHAGVKTGAIGLAVTAALMWGLWWIPVRAIEAAGLSGLWATLAIWLGALPVLAVVARGMPRIGAQAAAGAMCVGLAITLYGIAISFTDVVRAVLLFYLAPAWSIAIECALLGRRITWRSGLALALSFAGVAAIFRFELSTDVWSWGDTAAVASGVAWSAGSALLFTAPEALGRRAYAGLGFVAGATGCLLSAIAAIALGSPAGLAAMDAPWEAAGMGLLFGTAYAAPVVLLTLWAALRLPPATISFLLTAEILSGVGSSALFLDEPFGWMEAIGALMVAAGATVEATSPSAPRRDESAA